MINTIFNLYIYIATKHKVIWPIVHITYFLLFIIFKLTCFLILSELLLTY